jgi:hypothetical protein
LPFIFSSLHCPNIATVLSLSEDSGVTLFRFPAGVTNTYLKGPSKAIARQGVGQQPLAAAQIGDPKRQLRSPSKSQ